MGIHLLGAISQAPAVPADRGFIAWNFPPHAATGSTPIPTAGTLYVHRIRRVPAGSITNINVVLAVAGSALTTGQCFATLFDSAGVPIGTTADQSVVWAGAAGLKTSALAGGPFTVAAGDYYVGLWFNGTTGPALERYGALNSMTNVGLSSPNLEFASSSTGLTTAPPDPFGAQSALALAYWIALS